MVFYINANEVEFGVKLDEKEVIALGAGMAQMMDDGSLLELIEKVKSAFDKKADKKEDPDDEKDEEYDPDKDDGDIVIPCHTYYGVDDERAELVKRYLRKEGVTYKIEKSCTGRDRLDYKLWPYQVKELTDLITKSTRGGTHRDGTIII